jgi:hypothetical protein
MHRFVGHSPGPSGRRSLLARIAVCAMALGVSASVIAGSRHAGSGAISGDVKLPATRNAPLASTAPVSYLVGSVLIDGVATPFARVVGNGNAETGVGSVGGNDVTPAGTPSLLIPGLLGCLLLLMAGAGLVVGDRLRNLHESNGSPDPDEDGEAMLPAGVGRRAQPDDEPPDGDELDDDAA